MKKCFICGGELIKYGEVNGMDIFKCNFCGLGKTENLKVQNGEYHRDESYIEEEKLFENIFEKRVNRIIKFVKKGKVLEIGCSTGLLLSLFKKNGWEVKGVEISKKSAEKAREKGIEVISTPFEQAQFSEKFDLVILNHTLEHLERPMEVLKKVNIMLNEKGILFVDVPNFGGLSARLQGKNWPLLLPEEHLWHFTKKSLDILLQSLGFKIVYCERSSGIWNVYNPLLEIYNSLIHFKKRFFEEIFTAVPSWIVSKIRMGSDLMVIAKK